MFIPDARVFMLQCLRRRAGPRDGVGDGEGRAKLGRVGATVFGASPRRKELATEWLKIRPHLRSAGWHSLAQPLA